MTTAWSPASTVGESDRTQSGWRLVHRRDGGGRLSATSPSGHGGTRELQRDLHAPPTSSPALRGDRGDRATTVSRRTLSRWIGWASVLSGPITLALFIVAVVGIGLIPITVGIGTLAVAIPVIRWIADLLRAAAAPLLGQPVPVQPGHRRPPRDHREGGRQAHQQHLHHARPWAGDRRRPPRLAVLTYLRGRR